VPKSIDNVGCAREFSPDTGSKNLIARRFNPIRPALILLLTGSISGLVSAVQVEEMRIWRAPDHTRVVFDLSTGAEYTIFNLSNPDRVVIDLENSSSRTDFAGVDITGSPISGIRSGQRNGTTLRVVLDMAAATNPSSFTLEPNSELGYRLVVDLYDLPETVTTTAIQSVAEIEGFQDQRDIVIAIAAGHGGEDPGGIGYDGKIKEKDITLSMSRALYSHLDAAPGYKPVMIRDGDYYVDLKRRPQMAREKRADLFVALHADWFETSAARGVTIYALTGDRADRENARRVTEKENGADLLGGVGSDLSLGGLDDDVALTLVSLQMAWSMEQSVIAGDQILESLAGIARLRKDKVQQASLQVLNSPDIPSMLIETGYLTNPQEARKLASSRYQQDMTRAIAQGIMNYFYDAPPEDSLVAWQKENGVAPASYTVKRGDSLSVIAQRFGIGLNELKSVNGISSSTIQIGQTLTIPGTNSQPSVSEHKIQRGETLSEIAQRYRVRLSNLRQLNNLSGDRIMVGQVLKIPLS
jgi:N-acetylmuramoyl-L-alanine amidase